MATPARLVDFIKTQSSLREFIKNVKYFVVDEADQILNTNMKPDLEYISSSLPKEKQTLFFSATVHNADIPPHYFNKTPIEIDAYQDPVKVVKTLTQKYMLVPEYITDCTLVYLLTHLADSKMCIVFAQKCLQVQIISQMLRHFNLSSSILHSLMPQKKRTANLYNFRSQLTKILICTDLASRGLDIPSVDLVINIECPKNPDYYVHRVGRTARALKNGYSITFVNQHSEEKLKRVEEYIGVKLGIVVMRGNEDKRGEDTWPIK